MIKSDRKAFGRAALTFGGLFLILLVVLVFTALPSHQNILFPILLLILVLFAFGFSLFRSLRVYVNKRRIRALQSDQSLLAASQPVPDEKALFLPTTLQLRPRRRYFLALSGYIAVIIAVVPFFYGTSLTLPALAIRLAIALVAFLILMAIMPAISRQRLQYDLEVNEPGLSVTSNQARNAVNWSDARLFAVNDPKNPKRPKVYELATSDTVARWMWLPPSLPFFSVYQPTLPPEEYQQKMQAVLQLIEAKTHLPLYDIGPSKAK
jgi:hypothetical protein